MKMHYFVKRLARCLIKSNNTYRKKEKLFNYLFIFTDDLFTISVNHFDDFYDFFLIFDDLMPI